MQEPPMLREPSSVFKQLPISMDGQEPVPMSPERLNYGYMMTPAPHQQ
jgi:hypothetical protein